MNRRVFAVDMATCTGCFACAVACKDRAGLPDDVDILRVEVHESETFPNTGLHFRVVHCFHCDDPVCAGACPSQGITKDEDGIVTIDRDSCNACGECVEACPFDAISLMPDGGSVKCDGCADEVAAGKDPTCVRACPMRSLWYGPADAVPSGDRGEDPDFVDHGIGPAVVHLRRD